MADPGTFEHAAALASQALIPLSEGTSNADALRDLLDDLGWSIPDTVSSLGLDPTHLHAVADAFEALLELGDGSPDDETLLGAYATLAGRVAVVAQDIHDLRTTIEGRLDAAFLAASGVAVKLPRRLADYLVVTWLAERIEPLLQALVVLGVIERRQVAANAVTFTSRHRREIVHLDRLRTLVTDPSALFREVYGWGSAKAQLPLLIDRVAELGESLGIPLELEVPPVELEVALSPPGTVVTSVATQPELRLPFVRLRDGDAAIELGVSLYPVPAESAGGPPGLALGVFGSGELADEIALDRFALWLLKLNATLDLKLGVMLVARPGQPLRLLTDPLGSATEVVGSVTAGVRRDAPSEEEIVLLDVGGSGVRARGVHALIGFELRGDHPVLLVDVGADHGRAGMSLAGADSFLGSVLPAEIPEITFDLGATWSSRDGLALRGGSGLEVTLAAAAELGPLRLESITLGLAFGERDVTLGAGVSVMLALGPLAARVDRVGIRFALTAPGSDGNLGPLDLRPYFQPPRGVGLELDAGPVTGGGYLFFDPEQEQYAGVMQLDFSGIGLKAVGLLTTRLPGGAAGYSLLVIVSAEFTPIQLGMGFTLDGVGGLVGINRTVAVEQLRAGLKTGALDAILFPADPVGHAQQLVATLGTVFPPAAGRHVFGPSARIGWGTPRLITIDVALVLELPAPVRLIILGRVRAVLPDEDDAVVRIQMDVLGVIDFDRREAAADATLVDSRLAGFVLTGDMAMRLSWGASPTFLLAVGGFNPRFLPPPGFPRLDRIAVALGTGSNPRLRMDAYLALTSNTLQFGARLDLSVEAGGFTVAGLLAFDALLQQQPLSFVVDIAGSVAIKAGGHTLLSVTLMLTLSGPEPWHARGRASFSILFFDVTVHFDVTIGAAAPPALPETIEVAPLLLAALRDVRSWDAQLPAGGQSLVTLRALPATSQILAHPLGTLQVRQRVVPLERTLDRFGGDVPAGPRTFRIAAATLGGAAAQTDPLEDLFAPAQFTALSDDEKLSQPSFESMRSGVRVGEHDVAFGTPVNAEVNYEERIEPAPDTSAPVALVASVAR